MRALHILLAISIAAGGLHPAFAADDNQTEADAAKKAAAYLTNKFGRTSGTAVAEDGTVKSTGARPSLQDGARVFNKLSGLQGVTDLKDPVNGGVAGASVQVAGSIDLSCKVHLFQKRTLAGGVTVRLADCKLPASVDLEVCTTLLRGKTCQQGDFKLVRAHAGAWAKVDDLLIGAACNEEKMCRISIVNKGYSIAANGEGLKQAAQQRAAEQQTEEGKKTLGGALAKAATSEEYQAAYNKSKKLMSECIDGLQRNLANGQVVTCKGDVAKGNVADAVAGARKPSCSTIKECLQPGTKTLEFTRTCTRTFQTTNYSCEYRVPTLTCEVTPPAVAGGQPTVSCAGAADLRAKPDFSPSSATAPGAGATPGMPPGAPYVTVPQTGEAARSAEYADLLGKAVLVQKDGTRETYVVPGKTEQVGDCSSSPTPLAGPAGPANCATPLSDQILECKGEWIGRTQTEAFCNGASAGTLGYEGCGYCTQPVYSQTCRGVLDTKSGETDDSCSGAGVQGCELVSETAESVEGGIVTSATQVYKCSKTEETCLKWKRDESCSGDLSQGTSNSTYTDNGSSKEAFNKAMVTTAVMQSYQESLAGGQVVRVFGGDDMRCERPRGITSSASNDCCKISLERAGGGKWNHKCSDDNVKLAAARRAQYTQYIGEYCSKKKFGSCTMRTQTYCAYPGLLPRIVNQQGRNQLAEAVASSANASVKASQLAYSYYHAAGGGWTPVIDVNGTRFAAWQQPAHCAALDQGKEDLIGDPLECPGKLTTVLAACEKTSRCSELPAHPDFGSDTWTFTYADPLLTDTLALSRGSVTKGYCDPKTGGCAYDVKAWPAGMGGRAVASTDMQMPLFGDPAGEYVMSNLGDYFFRRKPAAAGSGLPKALPVEFSKDAGQTWGLISLSTQAGTPTQISGTDLEVNGQCSEQANYCSFHVIGTVEATAKPWGSPNRPDCTGFTPGQLAALDIGKMDLSEWIASVLAKVGAADTRGLAEIAKAQAVQYYEAFQTTGDIKQAPSQPVSDMYANVTPREALGPFNATVSVGGNYPRTNADPLLNTNPVTRVTVDWDDGTAPQDLELVTPERGFGYEGNHRFEAPNKLPSGRAASATVEHKVKISLVAKDGPHTMTVTVRNLWKDYTGDGDLGRLTNVKTTR